MVSETPVIPCGWGLMGKEAELLPLLQFLENKQLPLFWAGKENTETFVADTRMMKRMSYEDLILEKEVRTVYVGQSADGPRELAKACLSYGKNVIYAGLFEKAKPLYDTATKKRVLLIENWPWSLLPNIPVVLDILKKKTLGSLVQIRAESYISVAKKDRTALGSISCQDLQFLSLSLCPIFLAVQLLGMPKGLTGYVFVSDKQSLVEKYDLHLRYEKQLTASLSGGVNAQGTQDAHLVGQNMRLHLESPFYGNSTLRLYQKHRHKGFVQPSYDGPLAHLAQSIQEHLLKQKPIVPLWGYEENQALWMTLSQMAEEAVRVPL